MDCDRCNIKMFRFREYNLIENTMSNIVKCEQCKKELVLEKHPINQKGIDRAGRYIYGEIPEAKKYRIIAYANILNLNFPKGVKA